MLRDRRPNNHANHDRWLVSYADFITLLFAFFVVMFASAQADKGRASAISQSVRKALEQDRFSSAVAALWGGTTADIGRGNAMLKGPGGTTKLPETELTRPLQSLQEQLKDELAAGKVQVKLELRGIVISLAQAAYFPSGEDRIEPAMYGSLERVARIVIDTHNPVRLEGHTDTVPINNHRFRSNWELSAARSVAMMEFFSRRCGIPETRFTLTAHAHTVPADTNDTEAGRARNRRVNIVLLSRYGSMNEPAPTAAPSDKTPSQQ
jgi:chemotaxis protein MotB